MTRAQIWAIAALAMILVAAFAFAAGEKWQLEVIAIDAKTGEQLSEGARFTKAGVRSEFAIYGDCVKVLAELGPIPAHDGMAVLVYCQKVEVSTVSI